MAESTITIQSIALTGLVYTTGAADTNGSNWTGTGREFLYVVNTHGANNYTVTVTAQTTCNEGFTHNAAVVVNHGTTAVIGPFPVAQFNDTGNLVHVTYSGVASLAVAVLKL